MQVRENLTLTLKRVYGLIFFDLLLNLNHRLWVWDRSRQGHVPEIVPPKGVQQIRRNDPPRTLNRRSLPAGPENVHPGHWNVASLELEFRNHRGGSMICLPLNGVVNRLHLRTPYK